MCSISDINININKYCPWAANVTLYTWFFEVVNKTNKKRLLEYVLQEKKIISVFLLQDFMFNSMYYL